MFPGNPTPVSIIETGRIPRDPSPPETNRESSHWRARRAIAFAALLIRFTNT